MTKDYASFLDESTFPYEDNFFSRQELKKQCRIYDRLNNKYKKALQRMLELKARLEVQQAIVRSI